MARAPDDKTNESRRLAVKTGSKMWLVPLCNTLFFRKLRNLFYSFSLTIVLSSPVDTDSPGVVVFSYPRYCRYRALAARLEGVRGDWLRDSLVAALGGYAAPTANTRILYCKVRMVWCSHYLLDVTIKILSVAIVNDSCNECNQR